MPRLSAVLLIDADPKGLETLEYGFEGDGCRVTSSADYAGAAALTSETPPQVAVIAAREPNTGALDLARAMRARPTPVPVLMLGPPALRDEARSIDGLEFLPLPVFVRDVLTAAKVLVGLRPGADGAEETALSGALSEYGLFYLLRTMLALGRSGILQIERANRRGEIRFAAGEVTAAQVGPLQGSAAIHHLLLWEEAALDLKLRPVVHRGAFNQRTEDLLEEAERFLRDFAHASKDLGPTRTVLVADDEKAARAGDSVPAEVVPVLRLFDGQRSLGDVIEDSPFRVFDTVRIVGRLVELGILSRKQPAQAAPPAGPKRPPLEEWLNPAPAPVVRSSQNSSDSRSDRASRPAAAVRPVLVSKDQRSGPGNRRKTQRRDKSTSEHGTVRQAAPAVAPLATPSFVKPATAPYSRTPSSPAMAALNPPGDKSPNPSPAPSASSSPSPAPAPAKGELRTSGTIDVSRGELRSVRREPPPSETRSVVVDQPPQEEAKAEPKPDAPAAAAAPERPVVPPAEVTAPAGVVRTRPTAGVMQARPTPMAGNPTAPKGGSIELDPALMAELVAIEMANSPPTPPAVLKTPPPQAAAPPTARLANGKPAIIGEPDPGPTPLPVVKPPAEAPVAAAPAPAPAQAATAKAPIDLDPRRGRRPSSDFSALEKDFFEREADLYKEEKEETFDDLDRRRPR